MKIPEKTFEPIGEQFLFVLHERDRSKGGVIMPEVTRKRLGEGQRVEEECHKGTVVAVGAQCRYVRKGDVVVLMNSITEFLFEGQRIWLGLESNNVMGVIQDGEGKKTTHRVIDWKERVVKRLDPRGE